jgi:hypothetical protein
MYQLGLLIFILSFSFFTVNIQADETIQVKNKHLSKNYPNELIGDVSVGKSLHYKVDASIIGFDHEVSIFIYTSIKSCLAHNSSDLLGILGYSLNTVMLRIVVD